MASNFAIRSFETTEEFRECFRFQEEVWGAGFSERVAVAVLKVSQRLGGITAGAYDEHGRLAGFVYGMTGVESGEIVHWSDMLAVRRDLQDSGLGVRLKAYQRERLLEMGITRVHWTFDPLESKNAHLNLNKLGAVAHEYVQDMYGETDSPLHRGIGTDRLVPTWTLDSERVLCRLVKGHSGPEPGADEGAVPAFEVVEKHGLPMPTEPDLALEAPCVLVPIPTSVQEIKGKSLNAAVQWRHATRAVLASLLARGYEVRELYRRPAYSEYLLKALG